MKYYNENEFQYAIDLLEKNPFIAKIRFEEYISKYPKDYYGRAYYVILLTRIRLFDEAEIEYNNIVQESKNDTSFNSSVKRLNGFNFNMAIAKIKILGAKERYQEILMFIKNNDLIKDNDYKYISYYCRKKLGLLNADINNNNEAYRFNQCVNYSEDAFREHIRKHEYDYNQDINNQNPVIFSHDFPLDEIIKEIKKYIPSNRYLFTGYFDDSYYFKYDYCGRVNNKFTNYFKVICFHNTSNFITMYPTLDCSSFICADLSDIRRQDDSKIMVKSLSQIDKFNKRFHRN